MLPATPPTAGLNIFNVTYLHTIYVTDEAAKSLYQAESPWNEYEIIALTAGIESTRTGVNIPGIVDCYNLSGKKLEGKQHGLTIVRFYDGSMHKVMVK